MEMSNKYFSYDLYNTETEQVEATENHTADEIRRANDIFRQNGEPQRWVATPWVNQTMQPISRNGRERATMPGSVRGSNHFRHRSGLPPDANMIQNSLDWRLTRHHRFRVMRRGMQPMRHG